MSLALGRTESTISEKARILKKGANEAWYKST
jgi:hypothetical protein